MSLSLARRAAASQGWLEPFAERLQPSLQRLLGQKPQLRNALDGRWLGAPLHPVLTDVPLGAWSAAVILDAVESSVGSNVHAADGALAVGVLAAVPTALTGASDWTHLRGEQRRIGTLHAVLNGGGLLLNVASLLLRLQGRRGAGRALSLAAFGAVAFSAHLGGQLTFGLGVRVNRDAWSESADDFAQVLAENELTGDELHRVEVDGEPVLLTRSAGGQLCAIGATCSHLGAPLDEGERDGETVVCPWHGSRFDLCDGSVIDAPAVFPQPRYEVRLREGALELRRWRE